MTEREEIPCFTFYFIRILKNKIHFFSTTTEKETIPYLTFSIKIPDDGGGEGNSIFIFFFIIWIMGEGKEIPFFMSFFIIWKTGEGKEIPYCIFF